MLSLQTSEWCPYPCIPWNSRRLLWKIIIFISFSEHNNSALFFFYKVCISSSFQTLDLPPILRNIGPILFNIGLSTLSFQTLEFWSYPSKYWNSDLILPNIVFLVFSFQTLEFWSYPFKHWNVSPILPNIRVLFLSFQTLEFWSYPSKH